MKWYHAVYNKNLSWGHTVRLMQNMNMGESVHTVDPDELEEVILWAIKNAQTRRISYDTWQFKSKDDAEQFIMLYNLRWTDAPDSY